MSAHAFALYLAAIAVVILIPGPLSLLMVSNTVRLGLWRAWPAFLGGVSASVLLLALSALGLGALLLASPRLFAAMQWLGAAYLLYLGFRAWRDARALRPVGQADAAAARFGPLFRQAFLLGISNPKDIAFFVAFLPQFVRADAPLAGQLAAMIAGWIAVDLACKLGYGAIAAAGAARIAAARPTFMRLSALCFVGAGLAITLR
ncbi:LysE family translocator [Chitinimonas koreensis]|uniref:LysE family translocator n=1 Tax=Chitinimonas koreensis TaxID=356302 RepID=UPI0003FA9F2F|nr:LysE family translocator [Chitinimonas koreensis]QNM98395.1 LysE family translocator [Chitinimonas koreensis]